MDPEKRKASLQEQSTFDPDTIHQLRDDFNALLQQEKHSLDALHIDFQEYMGQQEQQDERETETDRQWRRQEFLRGLKETVIQKSRNICCLTQVGLKMIDYLSEQSSQQSLLCHHYETIIENLQYQNGQLSSRNTLIENDVEYFRQRLEATESQLENIVTRESEERESEVISLKSERERHVEQLEMEIERIRQVNQSDSHAHPSNHCKRVHSQQNIQESEAALSFCLAQSKRRIEDLEEENLRLQREIDYSHSKARSRRSSRASIAIDYIAEQPGEETERRKNEDDESNIQNVEKEQIGLAKSASGLSLSNKWNLLGEIRESLEPSSKLAYVSSNRSLFAHLELQDLVRQESSSIKCLRHLELKSATMKEVIYYNEEKRVKITAGTTTDRIRMSERGTNTSIDHNRKKCGFLQRMILKPVVNILIKMIWKSGSAAGCIG